MSGASRDAAAIISTRRHSGSVGATKPSAVTTRNPPSEQMTTKKKFGVSEGLSGGKGRTSSTASGRFSPAAVWRNAPSTKLASEGDAAEDTITVGRLRSGT